MTEEEKIVLNTERIEPEFMYIEYTSDATVSSLNKIKEVMQVISRLKKEGWPIDNTWDKILPDWFISTFNSSQRKRLENPKQYLWDYGSWLDAMKHRNWEWHCSVFTDDKWGIILDTIDFPYVVEPFEYIIRQSGVDNYIFFEQLQTGAFKQTWQRTKAGWEFENSTIK